MLSVKKKGINEKHFEVLFLKSISHHWNRVFTDSKINLTICQMLADFRFSLKMCVLILVAMLKFGFYLFGFLLYILSVIQVLYEPQFGLGLGQCKTFPTRLILSHRPDWTGFYQLLPLAAPKWNVCHQNPSGQLWHRVILFVDLYYQRIAVTWTGQTERIKTGLRAKVL